MVQLFRSHNPINIFWLIVLLFVTRFSALVHFPATPDASFTGLFSRLLIAAPAHNLTHQGHVMWAAIIVLIQALWFNYIINNNNLLGKPSFLPALLYLTVSGLFTSFLTLSEPLICNFLLVWMLQKLLDLYQTEEATATAYDLGLLVGIGTLIYFPFISLFLVIWFGLLIFRPFNWHEWVSALMGVLTIFFFLSVYYYCTDQTAAFQKIRSSFDAQLPVISNTNPYYYLVLVPLVLIFVPALFRLQSNFLKSMVMVRKTFQSLFFILLVVAFASFIKTDFSFNHFLLAVMPIAVITAYYFLYATKKWFYESLYLLLLFSIIYFQFNNF
ncbi:DUF6427 family protein [Mucilaginibacter arboris]|uniref:Beta-carotene 15,15'-monooxygenase n=1 Tax=Mucilaginibacter arboris TaxID=2682090 RepID=A0A7K1SSB2_9SPHI|nr:DUF6427 family protein [Mucilaginibacter arboris]MVN19990.1 beta-carotene 15,15'-monooxygenase [Mucilaginibacter arboris]